MVNLRYVVFTLTLFVCPKLQIYIFNQEVFIESHLAVILTVERITILEKPL